MKFQTIVVATDFTQASNSALTYARWLAKIYQARIVLAHVIDPLAYANLADVPETVLEQMTSEARLRIENLSDELLSAGIPSHSTVRQGLVTDLLLQVVDQYQADLLVLGTDAAHSEGQVALGSIAEQLVRRASCAVLAVPSTGVLQDTEHPLTGPILVPVQGTTASLGVLSTAQSLAAGSDEDILLLHVRTPEELAAQIDPCAQGMSFPMTQPRVSVRCLVRDGEPAAEIASALKEFRASLMVISVNRESRRPGSAHGTAFEIMAGAQVPVLCMPAAQTHFVQPEWEPEVVETC